MFHDLKMLSVRQTQQDDTYATSITTWALEITCYGSYPHMLQGYFLNECGNLPNLILLRQKNKHLRFHAWLIHKMHFRVKLLHNHFSYM